MPTPDRWGGGGWLHVDVFATLTVALPTRRKCPVHIAEQSKHTNALRLQKCVLLRWFAVALLLQGCLEAVASSLQHLEQVLPGSCSRLLCESMLQLSINTQPDLQQLKAAAASMFHSAAGAAAGGGGSTLQQLQEDEDTPQQHQQQQQQARPGSSGGLRQKGYGQVYAAAAAGGGGQQQQLQQQRPGMDCVVLQGVGQLGPLGSYLLARWREDVARSAAAAAQGML